MKLMATKRSFICKKCNSTKKIGSLFDDLNDAAAGKYPSPCNCGGLMELHLEFPFGLNASDKKCTVRGVYLPHKLEQWKDKDGPHKLEHWKDKDGSKVTFYPFLVVLYRVERKTNAIWMPYWHLVKRGGKTIKKYGQWAPCMDLHLFESLIDQARANGWGDLP